MRYTEALRIFEFTQDKIPDEKVIRKKYLLLSRKNHPDKGGDPVKFKEIQEAYDILTQKDDGLSDDDGPSFFPRNRRTEKDAFFEGIFGGFNEIFSNFQQDTPKEPVVKKTRLTVEELFNGTTREFMVQSSHPCDRCQGTGTGSKVKCADCEGKGVRVTHRKLNMGSQTTKTTCQTCRGRGGIGEGANRPCSSCRGHRTVVKKQKKHIRVPKGIPNNTKILIEEGDTPTVLQVKHPSHLDKHWGDWVLDKDRLLHTEQDISLETALLGGEISVVHPGTSVKHTIQIRKGIQPGEEIRIRDGGLPACPEAKLPPSDGVVKIKVTLPEIPDKHIENTRRFLNVLHR